MKRSILLLFLLVLLALFLVQRFVRGPGQRPDYSTIFSPIPGPTPAPKSETNAKTKSEDTSPILNATPSSTEAPTSATSPASPAATSAPTSPTSQHAPSPWIRSGRILMGADEKEIKKYVNPQEKIRFTNKIDPKWDQQLLQQLQNSQDASTVITINKQKSLIQLQDDRGTNLELVRIAIKTSTGIENSYHAYVDPSNGRILETWNHNINEPLPGKAGLKLTPSGEIFGRK